MKSIKFFILPVSAALLSFNSTAGPFSSAMGNIQVSEVCNKVAKWQIDSSSSSIHSRNHWANGALYDGLLKWADITGDSSIYDYLLACGNDCKWELNSPLYHADNVCVCRTFIELSERFKNESYILPTITRLHYIATNPILQPKKRTERWGWCDALFMGPPTYARMYVHTGDNCYLDYLNAEFKFCYDGLFDKQDHLFYRDELRMGESRRSGKKEFWGRGEGWVVAGLARLLETLPDTVNTYPFYEGLYIEMMSRLVELQTPGGYWGMSLLYPDYYPGIESSGTALITYALAWGCNRGLLQETKYYSALQKSWEALVRCVREDGKIGYVQPVGYKPVGQVSKDDTEVYAAGAMLMAGAELMKMPGTLAVRSLERLHPDRGTDKALKYASKLKTDGSWGDVKYNDPNMASWKPATHAKRIAEMALAYHYHGDSLCLAGAKRAMRWWFANGPVSANWWNNQIYIPKLMGPSFLFLWEKMDDDERNGAIAVMNNSRLAMTGQNKLNLAYNVLMRALMEENYELIIRSRDSIVSEIRFSDGEGLKRDFTFHQHGPQFQSGNYGLGFAENLAKSYLAFKGTPLALSEEQTDIARSYLNEGLRWLVWKGYFDMNACGRQIGKNKQINKAQSVESTSRKLDIDDPEPTGAKYFPYSDFGVYRAPNWYASVRMSSNRLRGFECTIDENMKGYFCADGALLLRRTGDEYYDITPCWNWNHVPGTTTYEKGNFWGIKGKGPFNKSPRVFGKAEGDCLVTAMELDRDGLKVKKAWFFYPGGIICLGAGITKEGGTPVVTTIEQNILKGNVEKGSRWARHNGTTYIVLSSHDIIYPEIKHTGSWKIAAPYYSDESVSMDLFEMYLNHGKYPKDDKYAYAVLPDGPADSKTVKNWKKGLKFRNDTNIQEVSVGGYKMSVDWNKQEITINKP